MALGHGTRLALDTNVLLDLAEGQSEVVRFFETSKRKGYALAVPATVLVELDFALSDASDKRRQKLSELAQEQMLTRWNVVPLPEPFRAEDAENFGLMLRTRGLLPMQERNDGLILAECSLEGIGLLVSSDRHLLDMDQEALAVAFNDFKPRLPHPVAVFHHTRITNVLRRLPDTR
ncbi:MAG TPA: type II toxin-antitoxin system VapC family toxin [Candidatus Methylacidiphilales bacterium]|jgi:predicted nucleic acid-binding protein|nr:type II toxin-antitoxin system VapC family toxin [Candidatus Methylacidiphilales bacterium]